MQGLGGVGRHQVAEFLALLDKEVEGEVPSHSSDTQQLNDHGVVVLAVDGD